MSARMNAPSHAHAWFMPLAHCMHVCSIWFTGTYASPWCSISLVCYALRWRPKKRCKSLVIPVLCSHVISYHNMTLPGPEGLLLCRKNTGAQKTLSCCSKTQSSLQQHNSSPHLPACYLCWLHFLFFSCSGFHLKFEIPVEFTDCVFALAVLSLFFSFFFLYCKPLESDSLLSDSSIWQEDDYNHRNIQILFPSVLISSFFIVTFNFLHWLQ